MLDAIFICSQNSGLHYGEKAGAKQGFRCSFGLLRIRCSFAQIAPWKTGQIKTFAHIKKSKEFL